MTAEILERGGIDFVCRPRIGRQDAYALTDVQRVYMLLSPAHRSDTRLLVLPRKRLPETRFPRQRYWAFVERVTGPEALRTELGSYTYLTKTHAERHQPAARRVASGVYAVVRHGDHTHLAYALTRPRRFGELERAMNLKPVASYIAAVMNPARRAPMTGQVGYPPELQELFGQRRYAPVDPPTLLDYPSTDLLLIGSSENIWRELGVWLEDERLKRDLEPLLDF